MFAGGRVFIVVFFRRLLGAMTKVRRRIMLLLRPGRAEGGRTLQWPRAGLCGPGRWGFGAWEARVPGSLGRTEGTGGRGTVGTGSVALGPRGAATAAGDVQYLCPVTELPTLVARGSAGLPGRFELSLGVWEGAVGPKAPSQAPVPPRTSWNPGRAACRPCAGLLPPGWGLEVLGPTSCSEFRAREPCPVLSLTFLVRETATGQHRLQKVAEQLAAALRDPGLAAPP